MARRMVVLHVEDCDDDATFFSRATRKIVDGPIVHRMCSATQAQNYLKGEPPYTDRAAFPPPDAIICDLRMPAVSGLEFLNWVQAQPDFRSIPFFVLTDSELAEHRVQCLAGGVRGFYLKPADIEEWTTPLSEILRGLAPPA